MLVRTEDAVKGKAVHPKMRSGWAMKSVIRSSMLRGSRTNVGKETFERSIPTLLDYDEEIMIEP
jgi:hypothetical protein